MNKPLRRDPSRIWRVSAWLALFLFPMMLSAQIGANCDSKIVITGSNYVCENEIINYDFTLADGTPIAPGSIAWTIDPPAGGTITSAVNTNQLTVDWNQGPGMVSVIVTLTNYQAGCIGSFDDTLLVEITDDFGIQLACNDTVQVSLGTDCEALITPDMVLEGRRINELDYTVVVRDLSGNVIPGAVVNGTHAGQLLPVTIIHNCSGNSCWGHLRIEDKIGPTLDCQDVMIDCEDKTNPTLGGVPGFPFSTKNTGVAAAGGNTYIVSGLDSCGDVTLEYSDRENTVNCIGNIGTSVMYTVSRDDNIIREVDTSDASMISGIPLTVTGDVVSNVFSMAVDPSNNEMYGLINLASTAFNVAHLGKINPINGVVEIIALVGPQWTGLTFNGLGDELYILSGGGGESIYQLDKYCGVVGNLVCSVANGTPGEAFAINTFTGDFYHLSGTLDVFELVNATTCARTPIDVSTTPLHAGNTRPIGLAFDESRGDFVLSSFDAGVGGTDLYRLTTDGSVTLIGNTTNNTKGIGFVQQRPLIKTITRSWTATDESGNTATCEEVISVRAANMLAVTCPPNYDDLDQAALECDGTWLKDKNGHPDPRHTGYPSGGLCENIDYDYVDYKLGVCENSYKIIREWLIADWCTGTQKYCNQIIKVLDKDGPQCTSPTGIIPDTFSINPFTCEGDIITRHPHEFLIPGGECADIDDIVITATVKRGAPNCRVPPGAVGTTDGLFLLRDGTYRVIGLPAGCSWIIFTFTDPCGNSTTCSYDVFIKEDQKPVAICDLHTSVTLSSTTGTAKVFATTFDDGSYDNCEMDTILVRRMDPGNCPTGVVDDTKFRNYVEFCCNDAGNPDPILVVLRVIDKSGNFNECMVEVNINDKSPPTISCPPNITVSCDYNITNFDIFGTVRDEEADRQDISLNDPDNPNVTTPYIWGRDGYYYDDCGTTPMYSETDNRNACGVGSITRTWRVGDANGNRACSQRITVRNFEPFDGTGIVWPGNLELDNCPDNLDPVDLNSEPRLPNTNECSDLLVTYKDQVYTIIDDACFKIIRTWTVLDWCNNNSSTNTWSSPQIIKIKNTKDPEFTGNSCNNKSFDGVGAGCNGYADLTVTVDDDCTPNEDLIVSFVITLEDGSVIPGVGRDASGTFEAGRHQICWKVEDQCENDSECCYTFTILDKKKPTPYCTPGIITVVMPSTGSIAIWASDFDDGSYDNCTENKDLKFSFSNRTNNTNRTYDCDDLLNGVDSTFDIEIWVTDKAGNQDFCKTQVTIQDGINDVCPDNIGNVVMVAGLIKTADAETVEEVMVMLDGSMPGLPKYEMTKDDGHFAFPSIPTKRAYVVEPSRNDDHLNGVSTLDLVLIQRHLLGISSFNTPFKHIAADVNNSRSVSAGDIVELRKLILGFYTELPNNKSWRFVNEEHQFPNPADPFPFDEIANIDNLVNDEMYNDFIAVKVGDINGDAKANGLTGSVIRNGSIQLEVVEVNYHSGDELEVAMSLSSSELLGFQYAVQFDQDQLQLIDIVHSNGVTKESNLGLTELDNGIVGISWNSTDGNTFEFDGSNMTFVFEAIAEGKLSESFGLNTKRIYAEAYAEDLEVTEIHLNFLDGRGGVVSSSEEFELYQNQPNPFDQSTYVGFNLPKSQDASITVFDVTGKTVKLISGSFGKGYNQIILTSNDLGKTGVLYYRLETEDRMATRKMILIE